MDPDFRKLRNFLKDNLRKEFDFSRTDQAQGVPPPDVEKPVLAGQRAIALLKPKEWKNIENVDLVSAIKKRRSQRAFVKKPLLLEELSFLLWATQGVVRKGAGYTMRTVPSAGARHALETYLCVLNCESLQPGVYRYLPTKHQLVEEFLDEGLASRIVPACMGQEFIKTAGVVFAWAAIPYRMEWRYGPVSAKSIAVDAGHVCQNLYLACEAVSCGTCAIGAYDQEKMDALLRLDGDDEFVIYLAPAGKVSRGRYNEYNQA